MLLPRGSKADHPAGQALAPAAGAGAGAELSVLSNVEVEHELEELSQDFLRPARWWSSWRWLVLTAIGVAAFTLELIGAKGSAWHRFEDALHLFPSGFPGRPSAGTSDLTQAAQLLAPLVGLFLSVKLVAVVFERQLLRLRARSRHGHVVVVGLDEKGFRAANGFLDAGRKVTCIAESVPDDLGCHLRVRGAIVLEEDGTQITTLRRAAVGRAGHVVCSTGADRDNVQAGAAVAQIAQLAGRSEPLYLFVHIGDPELAHVMRAATLRLGPIRVHFFDINAVWARALLRAGRLDDPAEGAPPSIVVVGATDLGRALVVRAARRWHFAGHPGRLRVTVVDPDADRACERIAELYPAIGRRTELVPVVREVDTRLPGDFRPLLRGDGREEALYLCLDDEAETLGVAMQARRQLGPSGARILLPATAWTFRVQRLLLDRAGGITPVFYSPRPDSLDLIQDSALEAIARSVHRVYLDERRESSDFGSRPADVPWGRLPPDYREATRRNVDELVLQLESLWYEIEPLYDWDEEPPQLAGPQVETLARLEHDRWCRERLGAGWRFGEQRDDGRRLHPKLVPWESLDEPSREIDRALVRARPAILAGAGYRLVQAGGREALARVSHERYVRARLAAGETPAGNPSLVPWEELAPEARELDYSAVDDLAAKLVSLGYRMSSNGSGSPLSLTPAQVERLAEDDHERWRRVRLAQGWRHGERRDDARKLHPDLVPWADLDEDRRRIDREQVEAIPVLLREAGRRVVRILERPEPQIEPRPPGSSM